MKFRDYPEIEIPREFENTTYWADTSWHNDVTASLEQVKKTAHGNTVVVWVYDDDPAKREVPFVPKYVVCVQPGDDTSTEPIETFMDDDLKEVLRTIEHVNAEM